MSSHERIESSEECFFDFLHQSGLFDAKTDGTEELIETIAPVKISREALADVLIDMGQSPHQLETGTYNLDRLLCALLEAYLELEGDQ